jgi:hypothetical protein
LFFVCAIERERHPHRKDIERKTQKDGRERIGSVRTKKNKGHKEGKKKQPLHQDNPPFVIFRQPVLTLLIRGWIICSLSFLGSRSRGREF